MEHEPEVKRGRPPLGDEPAKNRNIRLTDSEWLIFRQDLGVQWLRKQIKKAASTKN